LLVDGMGFGHKHYAAAKTLCGLFVHMAQAFRHNLHNL